MLLRDKLHATIAQGAEDAQTIEDWRTLAEGLLSDQPCVFHRNNEISALYAALYLRRPDLYKWAGMAAHASHHVRLALWPLRLSASPTGKVDLPRAVGRWQALRMSDVDRLRQTNNGIFHDIFWAHMAYDGSEGGFERLRPLLESSEEHRSLLPAFEKLERARRQTAPADYDDVVWEGNIDLLRHEQACLVQPNFDQLSCAFARAFSFGATLGFRADGPLSSLGFFTSFYGYSLTRGLKGVLRRRRLPSLTSLDERWLWIERAIVPRFRRYEARKPVMDRSVQEILDAVGDVVEGSAC